MTIEEKEPAELEVLDAIDAVEHPTDMDDLRNLVFKGMYTMEAALFTQAGFEYKRVVKQRALLNLIEDDLFDEETFESLDMGQKLILYKLVGENMNTSLNFMSGMHRSVTKTAEALSSIEHMQKQHELEKAKLAGDDTDPVLVGQLKDFVLDAIRKKTVAATIADKDLKKKKKK